MSNAKRIGVFGGQFDPPHNAHLAVVSAARVELDLDRVLVIPDAAPPHRPQPALDAGVRYRLAHVAFRDEPRVTVSQMSLAPGAPVYMADTLERLASLGDLHLIIGADQLAVFDTWHRPERIRELATLVVAPRPGVRVDPAGVEILNMPAVDLASTDLRAAIAGGEDVSAKLPPGVWAMIQRERLYD